MALLQIHEPGEAPLPHEDDCLQAIGIDLGTTHSVISFIDGQGKAHYIADEAGALLHPSVMEYEGQQVHSIKRYMASTPAEIHSSGKTPVEISADLLRYLKQLAENALEHEVKQAVITVPAYFDDTARTATRDAARMAGLEVLRLVNEPTAAALAYGLDHQAEGIYAIYDLGGGTFDISILRMEKGVFQVLSTHGNVALGGDDFDTLLSALASVSIQEARKIKEQLSTMQEVQGVSREAFEEVIAPLVDKTLASCQTAVDDANLTTNKIKGVVLVGGSTRVPAVQKAVEEFFGKAPLTNIDPDKVVALGAGLQASALTRGSDNLLLDVTPLSLGLETMGGLVEKVIHRNSPIPVSAKQEFTTYQDGQTGMLVHVLQGEREMVDQCRSLAKFTLADIPPLTAGVARVEVTFTVDADGLLSVSAQEQTTGKQQSIEVKPSYGLPPEKIENMIRESMKHAREDITLRLLAEARVEAKRLIHDIHSAIEASGYLLTDEEKQTIPKAITQLEQAIEGDNRDAIDAVQKQLDAVAHPFAQRRMDSAIADALEGKKVEELE